MLEVKSFTKKFKNIEAVSNISFTMKSGSIVGLLGPNGAGKSTTIKTIAGLLKKTAGEITIGGLPSKSIDAKKKFTYIPEVPELYDMLTVKEHLEFIANAYEVDDWEKKAEKLFKRYDLYDKQDKFGKELSKGMKQKVSICCGLLPEPDLYLFDEPMIGLDPKAIRETKIIFKELKEQGKTVFVSTHLLDSIENVCDRILVMKNGKIIADGDINSLKKQLGNNEHASLEEVFLEVTKDE
ncbi:ABC transporter ATP-binding protein [Sporosalibacterium faouarense]|uniref:ABC transporter ATP-binding protein n=1 Tax=Sporosalibacterium faouarense TaxID=516123 RepID=UPI00141CA4FB|nr:ABC transporter ATP-binding protein [Sporosalibacterium faouarense]MTI46359.1 ABC transporter ATP-binding protein [Bacillota bacterium]